MKVRKAGEAEMRQSRLGLFLRDVWRNKVLLLMISPATLYFILFSYIPMPGIIIAFKNFTYSGGVFGSPWVGLDNFRFFFISGDAFKVTRNTIAYNIAFLITNTALQCMSGIMLSEMIGGRIKKLLQSVMFLPYFVSWVVIGAFLYNLANFEYGSLNTLLRQLGFEAVDVYGNTGAWKYLLVILRAWKDIGYGTVIYLAAIMGIDQEIYEAADIDGANVFTKIRVITLPFLLPTIITLTLLGVSHIFRGDFGMFYNVVGNNGMLFDATDVIDTYVFRSLRQTQEFGMSAAVGAYQSVFNFVFIVLINWLVRKFQPEYALF
ncbi:MAG: ABC transporter permease subunit [Clostridiales bacterium]|jgi:putative aldouronate transport system permease protein|nr:ABC transporter permease subunit [Clostridiales bacterium]